MRTHKSEADLLDSCLDRPDSRSNLVRKDPEFYRERFGDIPDDLPYLWPASDR